MDKIFSPLTFEQKPFYNSVNGSQAQLWTPLLVSGPVLLLTISAAVVNIQTPTRRFAWVLVRRKNMSPFHILKGSNLAQRLRLWESKS